MKVAVTSKSFSKNETLRKALLARYSDVKFNDEGVTYTPATLREFLVDAEMAIVGLERMDEAVIPHLPKLKVIAKYGVGLDNIELESLQKHGVKLGWQGGVNRRGVAELSLCFMISLLRRVTISSRQLHQGSWQNQPGRGLREVKVGLLGLGHVGQELALTLRHLGVEVLAHDIADRNSFADSHEIKLVGLKELLSQSDILSVHIPFGPETKHFIDNEKLSLMRKGSYLVNTARGGIIDEDALYTKLKEGHLAGAAFDVFENEPNVHKGLLSLENFLGTPHIAGSSQESILAMGYAAIESLENAREAIRTNFFNY